MLTRFLVQAKDCTAIDPNQIKAAGGHLIAVGRLEDDGTVTVDVDVPDNGAHGRLGQLFAGRNH